MIATVDFLPASPVARFSAVPAAESSTRPSSFDGLGGNWAMLLREPKIPFSDSSIPRASGLLQKKYSTLQHKNKESKDKQPIISYTYREECLSTNFFVLVNFGTLLSPEALCPLAEPLPPDSAGVAGVVMTGLTTELIAYLLEEEGGLRRRKGIKNKRRISEKYQFVLTYHCYQQKRPSASESL